MAVSILLGGRRVVGAGPQGGAEGHPFLWQLPNGDLHSADQGCSWVQIIALFLFSVSPGHIGNLLQAFTHVQEIRLPRARRVFLISAGCRPDAPPLACGDKTSSCALPAERLLKQNHKHAGCVGVAEARSHSAACLAGPLANSTAQI